MIAEYEKFVMQDEDKKNDWFVEVNWSDKEGIAKSNMLKITFPNGDSAYTRREYLNAMLFAIGTPQDQVKMIPQRLVTKRRFEGVVRMKAKRDIYKGEEIVARCFHDLPDFEEEIIGDVKKDSGLYVPKK